MNAMEFSLPRLICKQLGVKHLVYGGLEHVKAIIGKPCPHFDCKGIVEKYLDEIGVPNTSSRYSFYFDNFIGARLSLLLTSCMGERPK